MRPKFLNNKLNQTFINDRSSEELDDMILEKKAIPDLKFKFDIFVLFKEMNDSEKVMSYHYRMYDVMNPVHQNNFEVSMVALFNYLKTMILDQSMNKNIDETNVREYRDLCCLEYRKKRFVMRGLMDMKNYLILKMYELNLTNLLRQETNPFDEFKTY